MNTIDILVSEHDNIKRVIKIVRKVCFDIINGMEVPYEDFYGIIDFIRNYADKYHHGKEEDMLFKDMLDELKDTIGEGPIQGMFIEHDYGRNYVRELEVALGSHKEGNKEAIVDIIANAGGYANLLTRHIHKEDNVMYKYATNNLKQETLNKLDVQFKDFEATQEHLDLKDKYMTFIDKLEAKYL
ncbi:hypothetical protein CLPU_9c00680 [Gottschalkia purinilytica]|uniref:Hemerythrin-like domain-containing protein n=1 Tax=Gottschalkia purinilytica TaxID=1503 RepID=A0A0L0W9Q0_GOTPU|nr:hemerythrin domain-containing protein [Gottschalkia purinilytica]KNF08172.1 hypothetical protein CLPU_9c00680 [Gottschalkia purinilytica]